MGRIVIGVDGSDNARDALAWAIEEATLRKATLHVLHSWAFPPPPAHAPGEIKGVDLEKFANELLDAACRTIPDAIEARREVADEGPARALIRASEGAEMVVVGARGMGGFKGLLLGSVSQQVIHHAHCPVVVVPGTERTRAGS